MNCSDCFAGTDTIELLTKPFKRLANAKTWNNALENFTACFKTAFVKYNLITCTPLMCVEPNLNIRMVEHKSTNFGTNASRAEYLCLAEYCLTTPLLSTYNKIIFKKKKKKKMSLSQRVLSDHPSLVNPQSNN